jgi:hypothetical protein
MKFLIAITLAFVSVRAFASARWADLSTGEQKQIKEAVLREYSQCAVWNHIVGFEAVNTVSQIAYRAGGARTDSSTIYVTNLWGDSDSNNPSTVISERYLDVGQNSLRIINVIIPSDVCEPQG